MIEMATFVRTRSGDLTTSGVFLGKTQGGGEMRKGFTLMCAKVNLLNPLPVFPGKTRVRADQPRAVGPSDRPPVGVVN
jgi:hypothetical protein